MSEELGVSSTHYLGISILDFHLAALKVVQSFEHLS